MVVVLNEKPMRGHPPRADSTVAEKAPLVVVGLVFCSATTPGRAGLTDGRASSVGVCELSS